MAVNAISRKKNSRAPDRVKPSPPLNYRQQRFVDEFLIDLNGTKAAIRAGYSEIGAEVQASRLIRNAKIAVEIRRGKNVRSQRVEISQDQTVQEIAKGCFWDVGRMFNEDGTLKNIRDMDDVTRRGIASFECVILYRGKGEHRRVVGRRTKIKLVDRCAYLELLGRHQGLFNATLKHDFSAELIGIFGTGIDFKALSDDELADLDARIAALAPGRQCSSPQA